MAIPKNFIEELTNKADIVEIISRSVQLTKKGMYYFGACPFHLDKTPSFSVTPSKQMYYCYSCNNGGSVINFIMKTENLSFVDAIYFLADILSMTVPQEHYDNNREILLKILKDSARFFYKNLHTPANKEIFNYLKNRGISKKTMDDFGVGFSSDSWQELLDYLISLGHNKQDIASSGLIVANKTGGYYDRFRSRIIFPIIDIRGNVIAFGGRALGDLMPKYVNSPETSIYSKGRQLFALNKAKNTKKDYLILAEGYMDVLALHQAGFDNAIASLGTALTEKQANIIKKYTDNVVIAYDSDEAGRRATNRAIEILRKEDIKIKVLHITGAKDPDEFIKLNGRVAFENLMEKSANDLDYRILEIKYKYNLDIPEQKLDMLKEVSGLLINEHSPVTREVYAGKISKMIEVSLGAMKTEIESAYKKNLKKLKSKQKTELKQVVSKYQPADKSLIYKDPKSARAEELIIAIIFDDNTFINQIKEKLQTSHFSSEFLAEIYETSLKEYQMGNTINIITFESILNDSKRQALMKIINKELTNKEALVFDCISIIRKRYMIRNGNLDGFKEERNI